MDVNTLRLTVGICIFLRVVYAQTRDVGPAMYDGSATFVHTYASAGVLVNIAWYHRNTDGTGNTLILTYNPSDTDPVYYNGYSQNKAELIFETNNVTLVLHNCITNDVSAYESVVVDDDSHTKWFNITRLVTDAEASSFQMQGGDPIQTFELSTPYEIPNFDSFKVIHDSSEGYDYPFDVRSHHSNGIDTTECSTTPCDIEIPDPVAGTDLKVEIDLKLISASDFPTFTFTYSDQTTTAIDTTLTPDAPETNGPVNSSVDPTTVEKVSPTIETETNGLELWIIIVIVIGCVVVVIIITVPVVLCCCHKPNAPKVNGQNSQHELTQAEFYPATPRENEYIDPANGSYEGKTATGLPPGIPDVQNARGRSSGYLSGPVAHMPVVSDVRDRSRSVYATQGYENQSYGYPPPDYDQHGHSHVSRVNVY